MARTDVSAREATTGPWLSVCAVMLLLTSTGVAFVAAEPVATPMNEAESLALSIDRSAGPGLSVHALRPAGGPLRAPFFAHTYDHNIGEAPYQFGNALLVSDLSPGGTVDLMAYYRAPEMVSPPLEALPVSWFGSSQWPMYAYSASVAGNSVSDHHSSEILWGRGGEPPWSWSFNLAGRSGEVLTTSECVWMVGISTVDQRVVGDFHNVSAAGYEHRPDAVRGYRYHEGEMSSLARVHSSPLPAPKVAATTGTTFHFDVEGPSLVRLTTWYDGTPDSVRLYDAAGDRVPLYEYGEGGTVVMVNGLWVSKGVQRYQAHLFTDQMGEWRVDVDPIVGTDSAVDLLVADLSDLPACA